jgi:cell division protein FtsW
MKHHVVLLGLCVAALSALGLAMLYSTAFNAADAARFDAQVKWFGAGLLLLPCLVRLDYAWLQRPMILYALAVVCAGLLLAVFMPGVGIRSHGANRWVYGVGQPSEFAKPVVILLLAATLARRNTFQLGNWKTGFVQPALLGLTPALLVFVEPDWGTAILLASVTLCLLLTAGARWTHLAFTVAGATLLLAILVTYNPVRWERLQVFLNPEAHRRDAGWQIWQSLLAIGSGGVKGHFLDGSLHKFGFVPEQQTDFIFARIGEETGLWGTTLVVLFYAGILWCGLRIARQARDRFGLLLATGCTTMMVLQAILNLAVATSMIPNKGLALPFVSYGGSGLVAMFLCLGLLGSVGWRARPPRTAAPIQSNAVQLCWF